MAHRAQIKFFQSVKQQYPRFFDSKKVLEIGSYNVNGTVRTFFNNCQYTGIDLAPGKDVDIVSSGHLFKPEDGKPFDVVISTECFEHNEYWLETLKNMVSLCNPEGIVIITCASRHRKEHGTKRKSPSNSLSSVFSDYYKNLSIKDFVTAFDFDSVFWKYSFTIRGNDLYFYGIKP